MELKKKEKKELTKSQKTLRAIGNWSLTIICIAVIVFALVMAIFSISSSSNDGLAKFGDNVYFNVASSSMEPTFNTGDVIVAKKWSEGDSLKVGQVVTFHAVINGYESYNTHRVVKINYNESTGAIVSVRTRGDNQTGTWQESLTTMQGWDTKTVSADEIVAVWGTIDDNGEFTSGKIMKNLGAFANWMQDVDNGGEAMKTRFFCIIVLPLILLFVIYAFVLVRTLIIAKLENNKVVQGEQAVTVDALSDDDKKRLAEEYLASLKAQEEKPENDDLAVEESVQEETTKEEVAEEAPAEDAVVEEEKSADESSDQSNE